MNAAGSAVRVLIADDSATSRKLLVAICERDARIRVVGEAADGLQALELAGRLRPSVILMDVHMPVLDGLEATKAIMREVPTPIIMVTAGTLPRDVEAGLTAVRHGALTVLPKPPAPTSEDFEPAAQRLVSMVTALADVKVIRRRGGAGTRPRVTSSAIQIVGVAASTGGPPAVCKLLHGLPLDLPVPVVVVQHIVEGFLPGLARWLNGEVPFRVREAESGQRLEPGTVYLAPDNRHLEVDTRLRAQLTTGEPVNGFRPSASVLFSSLARSFGPGAVGVVLTGMGSDGLTGLKELRHAGGTVLAQDEQTSVVYGMPRVVTEAGLATACGPVEMLADEVAQAFRRSES